MVKQRAHELQLFSDHVSAYAAGSGDLAAGTRKVADQARFRGRSQRSPGMPAGPSLDHLARAQQQRRAIIKPSAFAGFMLITRSNLVSCSMSRLGLGALRGPAPS